MRFEHLSESDLIDLIRTKELVFTCETGLSASKEAARFQLKTGEKVYYY